MDPHKPSRFIRLAEDDTETFITVYRSLLYGEVRLKFHKAKY